MRVNSLPRRTATFPGFSIFPGKCVSRNCRDIICRWHRQETEMAMSCSTCHWQDKWSCDMWKISRQDDTPPGTSITKWDCIQLTQFPAVIFHSARSPTRFSSAPKPSAFLLNNLKWDSACNCHSKWKEFWMDCPCFLLWNFQVLFGPPPPTLVPFHLSFTMGLEVWQKQATPKVWTTCGILQDTTGRDLSETVLFFFPEMLVSPKELENSQLYWYLKAIK